MGFQSNRTPCYASLFCVIICGGKNNTHDKKGVYGGRYEVSENAITDRCLVRRFICALMWFKGDILYIFTPINTHVYKLIKQFKDAPALTHLHTPGR